MRARKGLEGDTMTTAAIGATGYVGNEIVRGVLDRGGAVAALVRNHDKARRAFGEADGLHIRRTRLDDPRDLTEALDGIRTVFIAMGSIGTEDVLQRIAINAAAGISSIEQVTRLPVFKTSANSPGMNQRAHHSIDQFASSACRSRRSAPHLRGVAARCGARSARVAHMDRPSRQRPHGLDRPSRRGRGRAARAHRSGSMGHAPRPDRTGPHVVAGGARPASAEHPGGAPGGPLICASPPEDARLAGVLARPAQEDAPPTFSDPFYAVTITINASVDGMNGDELPISIEEVCDVPSGLAGEAAQLIGGEGVALMTSETEVFDAAGQALTGDAAATALAGADSVSLKAQLLRPPQWRQDEDGEPVPTFQTSRADITD
jgi:hypothetical protein